MTSTLPPSSQANTFERSVGLPHRLYWGPFYAALISAEKFSNNFDVFCNHLKVHQHPIRGRDSISRSVTPQAGMMTLDHDARAITTFLKSDNCRPK
jgi:hypothetical protein